MKRFSNPTLALVVSLIVSACGASQATPTINPVGLQSTVAAAAFTIMAETQAAIPTATPLLPAAVPTNTLEIFVTSTPMPTMDVTFTPTPTENPNASDPCINTVLPDSLTGEKIRIRIDNPTQATIMLSVYLQQSSPQSLCGYRSYTLTAGQPLVINDLVEGCYTLWAWNPNPKDYFMVTNGTSCLDSSKSWTFDIFPDSSIKLKE